jgi:hypothetical protein
MCGSLKHSHWEGNAPVKPGEVFPSNTKVIIDGKVLENRTKWNGFARSESLSEWIKNGWKEGYLEVEKFEEQGVTFTLPDDWGIKVIVLAKDVSYLNIVTRQATEEEKKIHHRFPLTVKKEKRR